MLTSFLSACGGGEDNSGGTQYQITVSVNAGAGIISSNPTGISCGTTCSKNFDSGTQVTLQAAPDPGYIFDGWSGACSGISNCMISVDQDYSVNANFSTAAANTYQLIVSTNSGGDISSTPAGINCGSDCAEIYNNGDSVILTATPKQGYSFVSWSGSCSGNTSCTVTMDQNQTVTAYFSSGDTANLCDGLITDKDNHPMTALAKPALGVAVTDPEFGTQIRRITAAPSGTVIKPMYSTIPAWNSDESYLILYHTGGSNSGHHLYDGKTYAHIRSLNISPPDLEQVFWSTTDPDILFYIDNYYANGTTPTLVRYHVSTDSTDAVHAFNSCERVTSGGDPMFTSWNSNVFGLMCEQGNSRFRFSYRIDTDTESTMVATSGYDAPQASSTGNLFFFSGDGSPDITDSSGTIVRTLDISSGEEHASLGMLADGTDTFYGIDFTGGVNCGNGALVAHSMTNSDCRVIVGESTGYPYPPSGTHISALAYKNPGWVAVSMVGYDYDGQSVLDNEIVIANTNPGGSICRVAHHRSWGKAGAQGYWAEPHIVISPSGTRLLYGSDWGGSSTVDAYVVELPSYIP